MVFGLFLFEEMWDVVDEMVCDLVKVMVWWFVKEIVDVIEVSFV